MSLLSLVGTTTRSLVSATLVTLISLPVVRAAENNTPPDENTPGTTYDYNCNNKHFTCSRDLGVCGPGGDWKCNETSGSLLNNAALWHLHTAMDYAVTGPGSSGAGCAPCGAAQLATVGALPGLSLERLHNYAFTGQRSSFGPGVFSNYDISLELSTVGYSWTNYGKRTIRVVDPASGPFVESTYDHDWTQADFTGTPVLSRVDATVDFTWGTGSPGAGVPVDGFAARWSGTVIPTASETYTFYTSSDDGVRLWVNNTLIIDKWKHQSATEYSGTIALTAGVPVSIRMEYYEQGGDASAKLSWSSTSTPKAIIPSTALRTAANDPGLDAIFVTSYGAQDGIYYDNDPYGGRVFSVFKDVRLYNASNVLTTDQSVATKAVVTKLTGDVQTFEIFRTSTNANTTERFGRLISWADRNGNAQTVSYAYPITTDPAQAGGDLNKLWMLSSVADAYGRVATITYRTTQVAGRWVVDNIAVPNGSTISYQYNTASPGLLGLSGVTYPDGTTTTITGTLHAGSQCQVVHYNDAGAESTHRRKDVYLTTSTWTHPTTGQVISQPVGRARLVMNGAGEATWYSQTYTQPNGTQSHLIYEGGQRMMRMDFSTVWDGKPQRIYHASVFNFGTDPSTWTWELESQNVTMDTFYRITGTKDALGRSTSYQVDAVTGNITKTTSPDTTFSTSTYDPFQQPLHQVDRLGRVTDHTYDVKGNRLTRTAAVGTADAATWSWDYNAKGQVLNAYDADYSASSPDLHVTSYVYNAVGYLIAVATAADVSGGARPTMTFAYDAAGRMTQSTDPEGRQAIFAYDTRNRMTRIDYDDATYETMTYGSGNDANLVTAKRDRNGNVTTFAYDLHGRLITKTEASGTVVAGVSTFSYLTGTNDKLTSQTVLGETTTTAYDFRNRPVTVSRTPRSGTTLTTTTSYDNAQRVAWTQDAYGRKTYPVYDVNDRAIRLVRELVPGAITVGTNLTTLARVTTGNPPYVITESTVDAEGQTLTSIDGRGITTKFTYDFQGRLTQQIQAFAAPSPLTALAYKTEYQYDAQGNQTLIKHPRTFTDGQNFHTAIAYTGRNQVKTTIEAVGRTEQATRSRTYTPTGKTKTDVDFNGNTTTFAYYPCCDRLSTVTDSVGGVMTYTYDGYGNVTSVTDANGNTLATTYDARHRVSTVTQVQENETTSYAYDDNVADATGLSSTYASQLTGLGLAAGSDGSLIEVTNAHGEKSVQIYDGLGRTVKAIDGLGHASTMTYDVIVSDLVETAQTDALGHTISSRADGAGRVRQSIDAENRITTIGYDANGARVSIRDPNNVGQDCVIDAVGRDTQCTDTAGAVTSRIYNAHGSVVTSTDALAKVTTCTFDARERKVNCLDRIAGSTVFTYDANNNLLTITDAEGKVTTYAYTNRNLLASETYPAGQATPGTGQDVRTYTYDLGRRLATRTDQSGLVTTYGYDHANRLTTRAYPDGLNDLFTYDDASRLLAATSQRFGTVVTRAYDAASRLTTEAQTVGGYTYTVGYAYDDANRATTLTHPNGKQTTRTYTNRNQLATTAFDSAQVASRSYDVGGRFLTTTSGNGLVETRSYNADNTVATLVVPGVSNFGYTYDANKRKTYEGHQFAADLQTFGYDDENRVTAWTRDGVESQSWTLSEVGDWNATTRNGVVQTRTHSDVHETTGITIGAVTTPLAYDTKGNLTQDEAGQRYAWDVENRLIASVVGAATNGYIYDALGRRLAKVANGLATTFVHDGAQVIAEYEAPLYQSADIGSPTLAGSFSDSGTGTVTVAASGADIWNTSDQFRSAYFTLTGDGSLTAKVATQTNTDAWAKAGVMLRDSLAANAKHAAVFITPGNGAAFQRRLTTGGASTNNHTGAGSATMPYWVRITRAGTTVTGHRSADGVTWTLIASDTVAFSQATIYAGLAVTSHNNAAVSTATFTNVSATGWVTTATSPVFARGYVYGSYVDELLAILPSTGLSADRKFAHSNHLYSVAALTDNSGNVVERYRYDTYGQRSVLAPDGVTARSSSSYGNQVGFTGRYLDKETGLWYFRARYYLASLGRFVGRDPWRRGQETDRPAPGDGYPNGWSFYAGAFAPNGLDPTGMKWFLNGNNIWEAGADGDTLEDLSLIVTGSTKKDWVCIWPIPDWKGKYPVAKKCDKADVSNLVATQGPSVKARMESDVGGWTWFGGFLAHDGAEVATVIKLMSQEGKRPLGYFQLYGHGGNTGTQGSFTSANLMDVATEKFNFRNTYEHSKDKIGPPRCWFCRSAEVRYFGCGSIGSARQFAGEVLRGPASAHGLMGCIWVGMVTVTVSNTNNTYWSGNANDLYGDRDWRTANGVD